MQSLQRTETHTKVAFKSKHVVICPQADNKSLHWLWIYLHSQVLHVGKGMKVPQCKSQWNMQLTPSCSTTTALKNKQTNNLLQVLLHVTSEIMQRLDLIMRKNWCWSDSFLISWITKAWQHLRGSVQDNPDYSRQTAPLGSLFNALLTASTLQHGPVVKQHHPSSTGKPRGFCIPICLAGISRPAQQARWIHRRWAVQSSTGESPHVLDEQQGGMNVYKVSGDPGKEQHEQQEGQRT